MLTFETFHAGSAVMTSSVSLSAFSFALTICRFTVGNVNDDVNSARAASRRQSQASDNNLARPGIGYNLRRRRTAEEHCKNYRKATTPYVMAIHLHNDSLARITTCWSAQRKTAWHLRTSHGIWPQIRSPKELLPVAAHLPNSISKLQIGNVL